MRGAFTGLALMLLLVVNVPLSGVQQKPIGEIITGGEGHVLVNGVRVAWGSAIYSGSEIQTSTSTAFVRFSEGAGALSISEESRVRISREPGRIVAEVLQGSIAVRADVPTRILATGRIIESDPANLYSVSVLDKNAEPVVRTLQKPVRVSFGEKLMNVVPEAVSAAESLVTQMNGPPPEAALAAVVTPTTALFADCQAVLVGCTLTVTQGPFGVLSFGNPVIGARVADVVTFRRLASRAAGTATSTAGGAYIIIHALTAKQCQVAPFGGTVKILVTYRRFRTANQCTF